MSRPGGIASSPKAAKPPNAVKTDNITRKLQHRFARNPVNGGVNINNTYVEIKLIRISIQGKININMIILFSNAIFVVFFATYWYNSVDNSHLLY